MAPNAQGLQSLESRNLLSGGPGHTILPEDPTGPWQFQPPASQKYSVTNGGFESLTPTDLAGWTVAGNAASELANIYPPPQGISQAMISNGPVVNGPGKAAPLAVADLETFLGASKGSLGKKGVTNGSAVKQTFKSGPFQLLTFQANFLTNEDGKSDFAFISINNGRGTQVYKITDPLHAASKAAAGTGMINETGYGTYTVFLPRGGNYTIGFGVVNVGTGTLLSTMLVDNVQLTPLFPIDIHLKSLFPDDAGSLKPIVF